MDQPPLIGTTAPGQGVILLDPFPRRIDRIFDQATKQRLEQLGRVIWHDGAPAPAEHIDRYLPETIALIGQSALDRARLDRAPRLRAAFAGAGIPAAESGLVFVRRRSWLNSCLFAKAVLGENAHTDVDGGD